MARRITVDGQTVTLLGDDWPEDETAAVEAVRRQVAFVGEMAELAEEHGEPYL